MLSNVFAVVLRDCDVPKFITMDLVRHHIRSKETVYQLVSMKEPNICCVWYVETLLADNYCSSMTSYDCCWQCHLLLFCFVDINIVVSETITVFTHRYLFFLHQDRYCSLLRLPIHFLIRNEDHIWSLTRPTHWNANHVTLIFWTFFFDILNCHDSDGFGYPHSSMFTSCIQRWQSSVRLDTRHRNRSNEVNIACRSSSQLGTIWL